MAMTLNAPLNAPLDPLQQQLEYYRFRAPEYDQWWLRQGRYDRGEALNAQWFAEAALVGESLQAFRPQGRVLELACGTGLWSGQLLAGADELTVLDGSEEMLAIAADRLSSDKVRYIHADLFQWQPSEQFDTVFFSFWLSHVPPDRFEAFWAMVAACLAPGGRVFFIDSRREATSTALNHQLPEAEAEVLRRRLNDGREFQIYKIFYEAEELTERLHGLGWSFTIERTPHYFVHGSGHFRKSL
jgi:SAM-dependent methyltransferase